MKPAPRGLTVLALALLVSVAAGGRAHGEASPADALARAEVLVRNGSYEEGVAALRHLLSADPLNRRARELLAFALESLGDLEGERRVRAELAAAYPEDPGIQADYGRVLERSGDEGDALRAYGRARELRRGNPAPELDLAIERTRGRTAPEIGAPLRVMSDPDATASALQAGAAVSFGSGHHVALVGTHYAATGRGAPAVARTTSDAFALTFVLRQNSGSYWTIGPRVHLVSQRGVVRGGAGGGITGRAAFNSKLEAEWAAGVEVPWDEAAVAIWHGGRTTSAEGRVYSAWFSRRLLFQAGARRRELSIVAARPGAERPKAWQSLWFGGADVVLWQDPRAAVRSEMLDENLISRTSLTSAVVLAYRRFGLTAETTPEFQSLIGLVPRSSLDEGSLAATVVSPRGRLGLELRTGFGRDSVRRARSWRTGGALIWAPTPSARFVVGYERASEVASGLSGASSAGRASIHVDL